MQLVEKKVCDLLIVDTWKALSKDKRMPPLPKEERDTYIQDVQTALISARPSLKRKPDGSNYLVGVDMWSINTLTEPVMTKKNTKRALAWCKDEDEHTAENSKAYRNAKEWFVWGIRCRGWAYNLLPNEKYFTGEMHYKESDPLAYYKVAKELILRFSDPNDVVFVLNDYDGCVLKQVIEETGRIYRSVVYSEEAGGIVYAGE